MVTKKQETPTVGLPRNPKADVLVIDDDESMCEACRQTLEEKGYTVVVAREGGQGLVLAGSASPHVVLVDLKTPGLSGSDVLARLPQIDPTIVSVVITSYGTIDSAVQSMKAGAFDFLNKPFKPERLVDSVERAMKVSKARRASALPKEVPPAAPASPKGLAANRQTVLLRGLEVLGEYYSLGLEKRDLMEELRCLETEAKHNAESLGQVQKKEKAILDVVGDLRQVDAIIEKHGYRKNALLQILLDVQTEKRWLPRHILRWVSTRLDVPLATTYRIAHFYEALSLEPRGAHLVQACTGTACHVRGATQLLAKISSILGIQPGQTDSKQLFTFKTVHCMGCCALAPVMKIDNDYYSNPTIDDLKKIFRAFAQQEAAPCRN